MQHLGSGYGFASFLAMQPSNEWPGSRYTAYSFWESNNMQFYKQLRKCYHLLSIFSNKQLSTWHRVPLTGGDGARQSLPFMGLVIFSWSIAFKVTFWLLGLWIPHVEATILDCMMFKVGKNTSLISFVCEMEMELTADVSLTLTVGEGARQSIPFMGLVIFSWSFAFKVTFRLLGLWIPHVEATILDYDI